MFQRGPCGPATTPRWEKQRHAAEASVAVAEKRPTSGREALPKALRVGSRQPAPLRFSELQKASSWAWHAAETGLVGGLSPAAPRSSLARCQRASHGVRAG